MNGFEITVVVLIVLAVAGVIWLVRDLTKYDTKGD